MNDSKKLSGLAGLLLSAQIISSSAFAGAKFEIDDTTWLSLGLGVRTSFTSTEDAAPSGSDRSNDFDLNNARLYFNGQLHENIKFELNTECIFCSGDNEAYRILDAIAKFEFTPAFNVWAGRLLVPADRAEMSGPFYANVWDGFKTPFYPADQGATHGTGGAGVYGRDDGVVLWGGLGDAARFTYALGVFDGLEGGSNVDDNLLYGGRLSYQFLSVEKNPGYYTSSTYYGGAGGDVLTVGLAMQYQQDGTGTGTDSGDFTGYSIDVLYESVLTNDGVVTLEAEYKDFDTDGKSGGLGLFEGDAWTATVLYLFPDEIGIGRFQPYLRYSDQSPDTGSDSDEKEFGFNYIINGHNARISVLYQIPDATDQDALKIGFQYQY